MLLVVELPDHPEGKVHKYPVAAGTAAATENTLTLSLGVPHGPLIGPITGGLTVVTETVSE